MLENGYKFITFEQYCAQKLASSPNSLIASLPDSKAYGMYRKQLNNHFFGGVLAAKYISEAIDIQFGGAANYYMGDHFGTLHYLEDSLIIPVNYEYYRNEAKKTDANIYAKTNLAQARAAGLQVGAYFFSQAISEEEAAEEAAFAMKVLDGFQLDLPLVYDWEYVAESARTGEVTKNELMVYTKVFCEAVEKAGYDPMIYFNRHLAESHLELKELTAYPFWLAMYTDEMTYPYRVDFWQYSDCGRIPGIEGDVDLNIWMPRS